MRNGYGCKGKKWLHRPRFVPIKMLFLLVFLLWHHVPTISANGDSQYQQEEYQNLSKRLKSLRSQVTAASFTDDKTKLKVFTDYIAEAHNQKSANDEAYGWMELMYFYYNTNMEEELKSSMSLALETILKLGYEEYYYETWSFLVDTYLYRGELMPAIKEAQHLHADAVKRNNDFGLGISHNIMGEFYLVMKLKKESIKHFEYAVGHAKKAKLRYRLLQTIYPYYTDALISCQQFDKLMKVSEDWESALEEHAAILTKYGLSTASLQEQHAFCRLSLARAKAELGNMEGAWNDLQAVGMDLDRYNNYVRGVYYRELTSYYILQKNYPLALSASTKCLELGKAVNDSVGLLEYEERHANLLMTVGRQEEAAHLFSRLMKVSDSLQSFSMHRQMAEIDRHLALDEVEHAKDRANMRTWIAMAIVAFMAIILAIYVRFNARIRKNQRAMLQTVQRFKLSWQFNLQTLQSKPQESLSDREQLYVRLCKLMDEQKPYLKSEFNRDMLVQQLNTNRTYLSEAIHTCADGLSISKFITRYRLQYAASLLVGRRDLPTDQVGELAGFNSPTTYIRLFKNYFGLTPAAFRNNSKDFDQPGLSQDSQEEAKG